MGERSKVDVVSMRLAEGDKLTIEGVALDVLYTPGHTDDSYSFLMHDRVFTGDTLLIRGTGRTDFQNGDPRAQYNSIFNKLLKLARRDAWSSPRTTTRARPSPPSARKRRSIRGCRSNRSIEYVELMNNLNLPNPKMMDVAVPANMRVGLAQEEIARRGWARERSRGTALIGRPDVALSICASGRTREARHHPGLAARPLPRARGNVAAQAAC